MYGIGVSLWTAIGPIDILIAGTALSHGATLVTHNTGEFERIEGLSLVDWYSFRVESEALAVEA